MADSLKAPIRDLNVTCGALSTTVVDSVPLDCFHSLQYAVSFFDATVKRKHLNLLVFKTETGLATQVYGRDGNALSLAIDAFVNGSDAEIRVDNMESFDFEFVANKLTT